MSPNFRIVLRVHATNISQGRDKSNFHWSHVVGDFRVGRDFLAAKPDNSPWIVLKAADSVLRGVAQVRTFLSYSHKISLDVVLRRIKIFNIQHQFLDQNCYNNLKCTFELITLAFVCLVRISSSNPIFELI